MTWDWSGTNYDIEPDTPPGSHRCNSLLTKTGKPCRRIVWNKYTWCQWHYRREGDVVRARQVLGVPDALGLGSRN